MPVQDKIQKKIDEFWEEALTPPGRSSWSNIRNLVMHIGRIDLPHQIISPNGRYFAGTQFYWDTYFTVIGLLEAGKPDAAKDMVDNLLFLYEKFGFMPARNSITSIGRSQPPFLTRMALEVYAKTKDDIWLDEVMRVAQEEYLHTWSSGRRFDQTTGLSKYSPWVYKRIWTTYESGWDVSTRFARGRTAVIPLDLNCLLYRYERDIEAWCKLRKKHKEATTWARRAQQRKHNIVEHCWSEREGFFFDYDADKKKPDNLYTLAGFFPLWAGIATKTQAKRGVENITKFKQQYGLSNTEEIAWQRRQWDHPNSWPPIQLIVVEGLQQYGYKKQAALAIKQWLVLVERVYKRTGEIWEKYDVVNGDVGLRGRYPTQYGFAWTIGVYLRLRRHLKKLQADT